MTKMHEDTVSTSDRAANAERVHLLSSSAGSMKDFQWIALDDDHGVWLGTLPSALQLSSSAFEELWSAHPHTFHEVLMYGKLVAVPRWSAAYGRDYRFSGNVQRADPVPDFLAPMLAWSAANIDTRFNAILANWYDGARQHRIGPHRDGEKELVQGAPIATLSFGERRTWRLRRWRGKGVHDIEVVDGSVLVMPYATNMAFTHEVPASKRLSGRRVSITIRAFT